MPDRGASSLPTFLLVGLVALLVGGGGAWFFMQRQDDTPSTPPPIAAATATAEVATAEPATPEPATPAPTAPSGVGEVFLLQPGEVFLQPAAEIGPNPFTTEPLAATPDPELAQPVVNEAASVPAPQQVSIQANSGGEVGLYGGSLDNASCDMPKLINFLSSNPDKAAAWVAAQNADPNLRFVGGQLTVAALPAYLAGLTPVVLLADTRVTNHGFENGSATPFQAVFQKGTAVLIDSYGVLRARCLCGNPLIPPVPSSIPITYVGGQWRDFDPANVSVVTSAPQAQTSFQVTSPSGAVVQLPLGHPSLAAAAPTVTPATPAPAATQPAAATQPSAATATTAGTTYPVQAFTIPGSQFGAPVPTGWETDTQYTTTTVGADPAVLYRGIIAAPSMAVYTNPDTRHTEPYVVVSQYWPSQPGQQLDMNAIEAGSPSSTCTQPGPVETVTHPRFGSGIAVSYTGCLNSPGAEFRRIYYPQPDGSVLRVSVNVLSDQDRNYTQTVLDSVALPPLTAPAPPNVAQACSTDVPNAPGADLTIVNTTSEPVRMYWHDYAANGCQLDMVNVWVAGPGETLTIPSYEGNRWSAVAMDGSELQSVEIAAGGSAITIP